MNKKVASTDNIVPPDKRRKPGRPSHLPQFNPKVPTILKRRFPELMPYVLKAIEASQHGSTRKTLLWLHAYRSYLKLLQSDSEQFLMGFRRVTAEELGLLRWLKHNGKHNWQPDKNPIKVQL